MKIKDIVAMMAVMVTAGGCTSNDEGTQPGEVVPIRLAATIAPANTRGTAVSTRAAGDWGERSTTQDTELLEGQTVRAWISENDGSHTAAIKNPIEYTVSNATGDLEPVSDTTPFYYPVGVNTISIHAIHPSGYDSGEKFTVNLDQTTEANYAASDLCYSQPADFTRSDVDANGRKLLQMKHLLSKIVVNLTLDENVTGATLPQAIKLHAMTSTVMTYPVDVATAANGYTGCTASDASDPGVITMKQEAIIPPQTIAAGVSFITFNVDGLGPMLYPLPAATTFESGKRYTYNIRVKNVGLAVTTSVNDWGRKSENQKTVIGKKGRPKLPIEYVAEHNMYNATRMADNDYTNKSYYFQWSTACSYFDGHVTITDYSGNTLSGKYHLPTIQEMMSVFAPYLNTTQAAHEAIDVDGGVGVRITFANNVFTQTGLGEKLQWGRRSDDSWEMPSTKFYNEYATNSSFTSTVSSVTRKYGYAIRLKATDVAGPSGYGDYTCAYRYTYTDKDPDCNNQASLRAKVIYLGPYSTTTLNDITNEAYWSQTDKEYFEVIFPACGLVNANAEAGSSAENSGKGYYWSNTAQGGEYIFDLEFESINVRGCDRGTYSRGFNVRLFKDAE